MSTSDVIKEAPAAGPLSINETGRKTDESGCFQSRELSWLQFNLRVLHQAGNVRVPLLERLKFLSIYYSNLDEFFMVRIGSLTHRSLLLPDETDPKTGWTAATELRKALHTVGKQQETAEAIWHSLSADLKAAGIELMNLNHLEHEDETVCKKLFAELRPMMEACVIDAQHPFPFLAGGENAVAVLLNRPGKPDKPGLGLIFLSRVPEFRMVESNGRQKILIIADLAVYYAQQLFPGEDVQERSIIRVTRNADVFLEKGGAREDFRDRMKKLLKKRRREMPVRLQMCGKPSHTFRRMLQNELKLSDEKVFVSKVPFSLGFDSLAAATAEMKYTPRKPVRSVELQKGEYFRYLEKHDLLLSFPYQSFTPFLELLYEAADDPEVVSIKITLYRLGKSSKLAAALAYASDRGKQVLCLLELRARFDEQNNIDYSEVLEDAGCTVIYGLPDQKVHSKLCLITRARNGEVSTITQVGTGNYNQSTCEQYCDLSLITSDPEVGRDAAAVFDALAKGETPPPGSRLWIAPASFKPRLMELLDREIAKGPEGRVAIKVNGLNDLDVMRKLMECSRAGVRVELFIRSICCLLPGIPGKTENITVKSVVGRHLEHSRIYVFGCGEDARIFIGSGDLLNRNTRRRVEAFIEAVTPETRKQVLQVMDAFRRDDTLGWQMNPDGTYTAPVGQNTDSQDALYNYFSKQIARPDAQKEKKHGVKGLFARLAAWFRALFAS